jgi:hypothetical protein
LCIRDPGWDVYFGSYHISESLETIFWVEIFFDADADPGIFSTLDPGWKIFGSGTRDKYPGSASLIFVIFLTIFNC